MKFINAQGEEYKPIRWLTFNDVLLRPQRSSINSRNCPTISTETNLNYIVTDLGSFDKPAIVTPSHLGWLGIPIISANMDSVTNLEMAKAMFTQHGLGILHRFYRNKEEHFSAIKKLADFVDRYDFIPRRVAFSIGCSEEWINFVHKCLLEISHSLIVCLDIAHGDQQQCVDMISQLRKLNTSEKLLLIAGNVATGSGAVRLAEAGADTIKVGIGPGSICSTRTTTGFGIPQLSAIMEVREALDQNGFDNISIIGDGGMKNSGDIIKSLAAGADAVMLGNLLAGTDEAPGDIIVHPDGRKTKNYRGQASKQFMDDIGKTGVAPEGISLEIPYKGPVKSIIQDLVGGIRSGLTYSGAANIKELREKAEFIEISHNGWIESTPHALLGNSD